MIWFLTLITLFILPTINAILSINHSLNSKTTIEMIAIISYGFLYFEILSIAQEVLCKHILVKPMTAEPTKANKKLNITKMFSVFEHWWLVPRDLCLICSSLMLVEDLNLSLTWDVVITTWQDGLLWLNCAKQCRCMWKAISTNVYHIGSGS